MACHFKKQFKLIVFITFTSVLMIGCVSNEVKTFEDQHKLAEDNLKKGNYNQAFSEFAYTLTKRVDSEVERKEYMARVNKIIVLYAKYPAMKQTIINYYENSINNISYKSGFNYHLMDFERLYKRKVVSKEDYTILVKKINTKIIQANNSGDIKFNFDDDVSELEIFQTEQNRALLYKNSLELLANGQGQSVAKQTFQFAKDKGLDSNAMKVLDDLIESNKIHYSIIKDEFSKIFPVRAKNLIEKISLRIKIENQSSDVSLILAMSPLNVENSRVLNSATYPG